MSQRYYRLLMGLLLLVLLYFDLKLGLYMFMTVFMIEGVFNWRIPQLITNIRSTENTAPEKAEASHKYKFSFEADRIFRIAVVCFLALVFFVIPEQAWFFPWFIGFMILLSGITGLCPMILMLQKLGFR